MSRLVATLLLDKRRAGADFPLWLINQALELTGDIEIESAA
jgi:hypothetical protein